MIPFFILYGIIAINFTILCAWVFLKNTHRDLSEGVKFFPSETSFAIFIMVGLFIFFLSGLVWPIGVIYIIIKRIRKG